jgi:hypothetical protein
VFGTGPSTLNWDLFCGPTPLRAYHSNLWNKESFKVNGLLWRGWDLFDDYSGHLTTNWGGHSFDMVQYALGADDSGPVRVDLFNGNAIRFDRQYVNKTPPIGTCRDRTRDLNRFHEVDITYASGTQFRLRHGVNEMTISGEKGQLILGRNRYVCTPSNLLPPMEAEEVAKWDGAGHVAGPHLQNWINAIRYGEALRAPVEIGHRSANVCHLVNIARQLGSNLNWNPSTEQFAEPDANALLSRPRRAGFAIE